MAQAVAPIEGGTVVQACLLLAIAALGWFRLSVMIEALREWRRRRA